VPRPQGAVPPGDIGPAPLLSHQYPDDDEDDDDDDDDGQLEVGAL
jgi:hypothetical protein